MGVFELFQQGLNLMLLGMGSVFIFLLLLIMAMSLVARVANAIDRLGPQESPSPSESTQPVGSLQGDELVAVISTAIARYRAERTGGSAPAAQ